MVREIEKEDENFMQFNDVKAVIFDLDGVIVDTAKYHYRAWKRLADELGFDFTEKDNERLKGISRMSSLEILLEVGNQKGKFSEDQLNELAERKNVWYVEYLKKLEKSEILAGAEDFLKELRRRGIPISLGSASKNSKNILERLKIKELFDEIVDGNMVTKAKPDPEVFKVAADLLGIEYKDCIVFEDSQAGIDAGNTLSMYTIAIGNPDVLENYDEIISGLDKVYLKNVFKGY